MKQKTNQSSALIQKDQNLYLQVYKRYPLALKKGKGVYVWDFEDHKYLDGFAGIAVNNLGHSHPEIIKAIKKQAKRLIHISNFYVSKPQVQLAEQLTQRADMDRVFFANSGAESIEGAIKLARKYAHSKGKGGTIISMEGCFHGRTLGTIATGKEQYQEGFAPIPEGFVKVPFNNHEKLEEAIDPTTAAIIIEPIQGEGGIHPAHPEFLQKARDLCDQHDIVLIFDEIQCGVGRTGSFFAYEQMGVKPDIVTIAKSLGSGVPIGAVLIRQSIANAIDYGEHGTTFGGNPLACASALATLKTMDKENIIKKTAQKGDLMLQTLRERATNVPAIKEVRGKGLMIGVELNIDGRPVVNKMMEKGVLANATGGNTIRFVPPLIIKKKEILFLIDQFIQSINEIQNQ